MTPEIEKRIKAVKAGRVPAGYKKTKVGIVPKEWDERILSDISIHVTEKNRNNDFQTTFTNSATKGVIKQTEYFDKQISNKDNTDGYYVVRKFDYIYNPRISESAPCGPINQSHFDKTGIVSPLYTVFRLHKDLKENHYIEAYLKSHFWHRYMCGVANYGARHDRMNITNEDLFNLPIPFPPFEEQKKIAEILSAQDKIIELKEKLIAEKQHQKKYLMQSLLDEKIKRTPFKINGIVIDKKKWEKKKLGDICNTFSGGTPNRSHSEYFGGDIPWIKSGELNQGQIYNTEEFLTKKGMENSSAKIVPKETLLIAMYGATAGILAYTFIDAAINQAILALIPKREINKIYLKSVIEIQIDNATHRLVQGGQPNFNASIIESFLLSIPSLPEQQAIAAVLSSADEEISLLQRDLEQEKLKKKSLMQLLLTGLARV